MDSTLFEIIEKLPKIYILWINFFISLVMIIIKYKFDKYVREKEVLSSARINLNAFIKILDSAITNNDKNLAKDHYKLLLNNSYLFYKCESLNIAFVKIQEYYIGLQVDSFDSLEKKERVLQEIESINKNLKAKCC